MRRPGYPLDRVGHGRQAEALEPLARQAKSMKPLDPSVKPLLASPVVLLEKDAKWKLVINETVEPDF